MQYRQNLKIYNKKCSGRSVSKCNIPPFKHDRPTNMRDHKEATLLKNERKKDLKRRWTDRLSGGARVYGESYKHFMPFSKRQADIVDEVMLCMRS